MNRDREIQERLGANDTVVDLLIREQDKMGRRQDQTDDGLAEHVKLCGRLQKLQIIIGCVILLLIEAHSPEAAKLVDSVVRGLLP